MSIAEQIIRIQDNIAASYAECSAKGATLPAEENSANLPDTIASITAGGGGGGIELSALNYSGKALAQWDWAHINKTLTTSTLKSTHSIPLYTSRYFQFAPNKWFDTASTVNAGIMTLEESGDYSFTEFNQTGLNIVGIDYEGALWGTGDSSQWGVIYYNPTTGVFNTSKGDQNMRMICSDFAYNETDSFGLFRMDKTTGWVVSPKYTSATGYQPFAFDGYCTGFKINDNKICVIPRGQNYFSILTLDDDAHTYTFAQFSDLSCDLCLGKITLSDGSAIILGRKINIGLCAFKLNTDETISIMTKDEFPSDIAEMFEKNNLFAYVNEQTKTLVCRGDDKMICYQFNGSEWINKTPLFNDDNFNYNCDCFVSPDFSTFTIIKDNNGLQINYFAVYEGNELASGNYVVPYSYTNSQTIMGKVTDAVSAEAGTQCTVVIPANSASGGVTGDEVEAVNYSGKDIKEGDKVWLNKTANTTEKAYEFDISYSSGDAPVIMTSNPNIAVGYGRNSGFVVKTLTDTGASTNILSSSRYYNPNCYMIDKNNNFIGIAGSGVLIYNIDTHSLVIQNSGSLSNDGISANYTSKATGNYSTPTLINKINPQTGDVLVTYTGPYIGYSCEIGGKVYSLRNGTLGIVQFNDSDNTWSYSKTAKVNQEYLLGGMTEPNILFAGNKYSNDYKTYNLSILSAETLELIDYSTLPDVMQQCLANPTAFFINDYSNIFSAYIPALHKFVVLQYVNGKWIDRSPVLDVTDYRYNSYGAFFSISADFSRMIYPLTDHKMACYNVKSSEGYNAVPYQYATSSTITGVAREDAGSGKTFKAGVVLPVE